MQSYLSETHSQIKLRLHYHHNYPPHFHRELELIFMQDGCNRVNMNGVTYQIPAGSVFLAPPNTIHSYQNPLGECTSLLLIVDPSLLVGPGSQLSSQTPLSPIWSDPEKTSDIWSMIQFAYDHGRSMSRDSFILLISTIISMVLDNMPLSNSDQPRRTEQRILNYCQQHYHEPITSDMVAAAVGLSRSRLSHIFNNVLQIPVPVYINGLRLNDALSLLTNTKMSTIDIAARAGFTSLRNFNRVFTEKFGFTPSQCRKQHLEKNLQSFNFK